jgi:hypothetical protein
MKNFVTALCLLSISTSAFAGAGGTRITCTSANKAITVSFQDDPWETVLDISDKGTKTKVDMRAPGGGRVFSILGTEDSKMVSLAVKAPDVFLHMASLPDTLVVLDGVEGTFSYKAQLVFDTKTGGNLDSNLVFNCETEDLGK